jgi:hypothetical protein
VMTLSAPSFLQAATRPFMPPKAATDVAVAALVELAVLPPLDPPEDELLQPAASTTLLTAAAAMNNFLVGTSYSPPNRETTGSLRRPGAVDASIVTSPDVRSVTNSRAANGALVKRSGQFTERLMMQGQPGGIGWMAPGRTETRAGQARQSAWVSLRTSGSLPSSRTRAALVRPSAHSVSSAGSPVTVTIGVRALAVIRTC